MPEINTVADVECYIAVKRTIREFTERINATLERARRDIEAELARIEANRKKP